MRERLVIGFGKSLEFGCVKRFVDELKDNVFILLKD